MNLNPSLKSITYAVKTPMRLREGNASTVREFCESNDLNNLLENIETQLIVFKASLDEAGKDPDLIGELALVYHKAEETLRLCQRQLNEAQKEAVHFILTVGNRFETLKEFTEKNL